MTDDNYNQHIQPPQSAQQLLERCQAMAGKTLGQIAAEVGVNVPEDLRRHKGWVGNLFETYLGASAGNKAEPDFIELGIEMKTLPLNSQGKPKESTYVCTVSLQQTGELSWQDSWVRRKLSQVLWVPVEAERTLPLAERYVGNAWLWQPTHQQEEWLRRDWEELMDRIVLGEQSEINGSEGEYLHLRPKAANSRVLARGVGGNGLPELVNPKGFYLRTSFTNLLLSDI